MLQVDLRHLLQSEDSNEIDVGIDLTDYYISVEWDILRVPAVRNEKFYICCEEPYPDIMFYITLRRKTLFYTVNLIIPCVGISFLSVLVFYLPSHSGEKVSLSISILLSLTVFFLLLVEIIPSTSLTVPLLGKYLLFTMVLVTLSVVVTIAVLNVNFRSPVTHKMAPWVRVVFIEVLPKFLLIERPKKNDGDDGSEPDDDDDDIGKPPEAILTDVFHMSETDKYGDYCGKRYSEYELPSLPSLPRTCRTCRTCRICRVPRCASTSPSPWRSRCPPRCPCPGPTTTSSGPRVPPTSRTRTSSSARPSTSRCSGRSSGPSRTPGLSPSTPRIRTSSRA
jgi:nicotinic acetylcholine receptor